MFILPSGAIKPQKVDNYVENMWTFKSHASWFKSKSLSYIIYRIYYFTIFQISGVSILHSQIWKKNFGKNMWME